MSPGDLKALAQAFVPLEPTIQQLLAALIHKLATGNQAIAAAKTRQPLLLACRLSRCPIPDRGLAPLATLQRHGVCGIGLRGRPIGLSGRHALISKSVGRREPSRGGWQDSVRSWPKLFKGPEYPILPT